MVHQYKSNGYNIVLDVCSGSVHVVDDLVYDIIANYENHTKEQVMELLPSYDKDEVSEAYDEVTGLVEDGTLFTEDIFKDYIIDFKKRKTVVKALCINIAHDCNLACRYCFAGEGEYKGDRGLMPLDIAKKSLDFLVANSGNRVNLEVDFFGGEPLMNWHVVQQTVTYVRQQEKKHDKKIKMSLTTNGMLLDKEKVKYLTDNHISLILSLDGRKEMHDSMRPGVNNEGTYDRIMKNLQYCIKHRNGEEYYVRGTFTRQNLDFTTDVEDMLNHGFPAVSMEPVVGDDTADYSIKEADLPRVKDEYDKLAKFFIKREEEGNPFFFFHFNMDLWRGPCLPKRLRGC